MTSEQVDQPQQPPAISDRPRTPAKYNSLGRRRVPTSSNGVNGQNHTYERLEDLLREAGYKETRIFTPESKSKSKVAKLEHPSGPEAANTHPRRNSAVETVVGFFTGFIPASATGEGRPNVENQHHSVYESPPSFTGRSEPTSPSPTSKKPTLRRDLYAAKSELPRPNNRLPPPSREPPPHAHAYLRHMVSAPNIHNIHALRRTQSTRTASAGRRQMNSRSNTDPPLPQTWLQNVAKAVLFGGEGAHAGGPPPSDGVSQPGPSVHGHSPLRSSRLNQSVISNDADPSNGLGDSPNHVGYLRPPGVELMAGKVRVGRPSRSESQVSHTAVMCRSAPASRASSRVRGGDTTKGKGHDHQLDVAAMMDRLVKDDSERQIRGRQWQSKTSKKKRTRDNVPSLARTHTTGDTWASEARRPLQRHTSKLSPNQRRGLGLSDDDDDDRHMDSDDSDDEGAELNLAQLLVPPKRQNSIRSLRKHLDAGVRHSYHAKQRQRAETDVEEDTEDYLTWGTSGRRTLAKSRRGVMPGWQSGS